MTTFGRLISDPTLDFGGATATAAVTVGDAVIHVDDVSDFDEDASTNGGVLVVGVDVDGDGNIDQSAATRIPYTTFDEDAGTVTLAWACPVAIDSGDFVYVLDPVTDAPYVDVTAFAEIEGADKDGDPLPVLLTHALAASLDGTDAEGTPVVIDTDEDDQLVASGMPGSNHHGGATKFDQVDDFTVTQLGTQVFDLHYRPIANSEHVYWHPAGGAGIYQVGALWSRDGWTVTIPDSAGRVQVGDMFTVEYAYIDPTPPPVVFRCDQRVSLPLEEFEILHRVASFTPWGRYVDGVICPNPDAVTEAGADWADYYHPALTLDPTKSYEIRVTFDPTSPHDDGNRDVYVTSARPGFEVTDFDSSYSSFPGHLPWSNLHDSRPRYTDGNVTTFLIGPGIAGWDDPTWGPAAGFTRAVIETEGGAVSSVEVRKVCTWVEAEILWQLDDGVPDPLGGATLVGTDVAQALGDHSDASYVEFPHGAAGSIGPTLRWVPTDLTGPRWERMWLEFEVEVVGGGTAELNWTLDFPYNYDGSTTMPYDDSGQLWHTPATVSTGTYVQHVPLDLDELDSFTGDSGEFSNFTIDKTVAAAAHTTWPTTGHYLGLVLTVFHAENARDVRVKRLALKVARPADGA